MFTNKNKISNQNTYYRQNRKQNYGFSCGGSSNQTYIETTKIPLSKNNDDNSVSTFANSERNPFSSLYKEINSNINLINSQNNTMGAMFQKNSMFKKRRGCGCGGRK